MNSPQHQVIIAGAGPAGAMTAYYLAQSGVDVALLEKKPLPRYKPCGGGISGRTRRELPFAIDPVIEQEISGIAFNFWGRWLTRRHTSPIAWMVMRSRFDEFLVQQAVAAGARFYQETSLIGAPIADVDGISAPTSGGVMRSQILVGADGANSLVAKAFGLMPNTRAYFALEHEVSCPEPRAREWHGLVEIDFAYQPWGYGWVFPKADHISVGLAVTPAAGRTMKSSLGAYRDRRNLEDMDTLHAEGHKIPSRDPRDPLHGPRVLLVGDAAGLTDEFSAEGIFYAVCSARLAANAARDNLHNNEPLAAYTRAVDSEIMPELAAARGVARLFFAAYRYAPWLVRPAVERISYYTRILFEVQAGETDYVRLQRRWPFLAPVWRRLNQGTLAV